MKMPNEPVGSPSSPFDLTGYTCVSIINCPVEQAVQLIEEYEGICAIEHGQQFQFLIAAVPEAPEWALIRWPRPGRFYDLMNLTMWLMGYQAGLGGENPVFVALPPAERASESPLLARPDYDDPFGDSMIGYWQGRCFEYSMPEQKLGWISSNAHPNFLFQARYHALIDFRLEWLEDLERISDWTGCLIQMEDPSVQKGS